MLAFTSLVFSLPFLAPVALASCAHGISFIHPRSEIFEAPEFNYGIKRGQMRWHALKEDWEVCGLGQRQSPIMIDEHRHVKTNMVKLHFPHEQIITLENLQNTGTSPHPPHFPSACSSAILTCTLRLRRTVEVVAKGTLETQNRTWEMAQFHFHTPGEHRFGQGYFDAEMHMVFAASDGSEEIAVVGFPISVAPFRSTFLLEQVFANLSAVEGPGSSVEIPILDLKHFEAYVEDFEYYTYEGSLTTPPCSEIVSWHVASTPLFISSHTLSRLQEVMPMNNRYVQSYPGEENIIVVAAEGLE